MKIHDPVLGIRSTMLHTCAYCMEEVPAGERHDRQRVWLRKHVHINFRSHPECTLFAQMVRPQPPEFYQQIPEDRTLPPVFTRAEARAFRAAEISRVHTLTSC